MALQGPIPVAFGFVFPYGAFVKGVVEPVRDFDRSSSERFVQATDKNTGVKVWQVEVIDADPAAKGATKVKLFGEVQPVPPAAPAGFPFAAVEFTDMTVTPYVNSSTNRLAYSYRAGGMREPATGGAGKTSTSSGSSSGSGSAGSSGKAAA